MCTAQHLCDLAVIANLALFHDRLMPSLHLNEGSMYPVCLGRQRASLASRHSGRQSNTWPSQMLVRVPASEAALLRPQAASRPDPSSVAISSAFGCRWATAAATAAAVSRPGANAVRRTATPWLLCVLKAAKGSAATSPGAGGPAQRASWTLPAGQGNVRLGLRLGLVGYQICIRRSSAFIPLYSLRRQSKVCRSWLDLLSNQRRLVQHDGTDRSCSHVPVAGTAAPATCRMVHWLAALTLR